VRVLFLCTGNSCRSQMAEGWGRALLPEHTFASAGLVAHGLNQRAVQVMGEAGVDIAGHASQTLAEVEGPFDLVVTVCDHAAETCPVLPGARTIHAGFPDPPKLAADAASEAEALIPFREVRDRIRAFVADELPAHLG